MSAKTTSTGWMRAVILEQNDAANYIPALEEFRHKHRRLRGVYLIHDGGPSHIAGATAEYFDGCHRDSASDHGIAGGVLR